VVGMSGYSVKVKGDDLSGIMSVCGPLSGVKETDERYWVSLEMRVEDCGDEIPIPGFTHRVRQLPIPASAHHSILDSDA